MDLVCEGYNRSSLVYVFPKKKVTYLGGQVGDQAWKFGSHWVKVGRIGDPTGCNVEPCNPTANWQLPKLFGRCEQHTIYSMVYLFENEAAWAKLKEKMVFTTIWRWNTELNFWLKLNGRKLCKNMQGMLLDTGYVLFWVVSPRVKHLCICCNLKPKPWRKSTCKEVSLNWAFIWY